MAETALTRVSKAKAQALAETNGKRGEVLLSLVEDQEWLNPTLLVVLSTQLVQSTLLGVLAARLFGGWGVVAATVINVTLFFVVAEVAPKTWAIQHTDRAALAAARPIKALAGWGPLKLLSRGLIGLTNVLLPGKGLKRGPYTSEEELLAVADLAVEDAVIEAEERRLIESVIELGDTVVREVMVPRTDMVTVTADFRVADAMEVAILNGYSRIPVCGEGIDDIVGIVHAKDLMRAERDDHEDRAGERAGPAGPLRARDQGRGRPAAGDAAAAVPHGDRDRRVRRHRRAGHPRGHHRGAARRDRRRVRRRGRHDRAAARRRLPGERAHGRSTR